MKAKVSVGLITMLFLASMLGMVTPAQANNSIDTTGIPSHWAIITLNDENNDQYGELWLIGWYTTESYEPGLDGTINHVIWEVVHTSMPTAKVNVGDNVFSIHGWYEDGRYKWIHNAKDFNIHLETDFYAPGYGWSPNGPHGGLHFPVSGKTYGTRVHGEIEWHWLGVGTVFFNLYNWYDGKAAPYDPSAYHPMTPDWYVGFMAFKASAGSLDVDIFLTQGKPSTTYLVLLWHDYRMPGQGYWVIGTLTTDDSGRGSANINFPLTAGPYTLGIDLQWDDGTSHQEILSAGSGVLGLQNSITIID